MTTGDAVNYDKLIEFFKRQPNRQLKAAAKERGIDTEKGDIIIVPKGFAEAQGIEPEDGIQISSMIDCSVCMIKKCDQDIGESERELNIDEPKRKMHGVNRHGLKMLQNPDKATTHTGS